MKGKAFGNTPKIVEKYHRIVLLLQRISHPAVLPATAADRQFGSRRADGQPFDLNKRIAAIQYLHGIDQDPPILYDGFRFYTAGTEFDRRRWRHVPGPGLPPVEFPIITKPPQGLDFGKTRVVRIDSLEISMNHGAVPTVMKRIQHIPERRLTSNGRMRLTKWITGVLISI